MAKKTSRTDWLMERRTGIGGSDVAAILGLSKWKSSVDLWMDKTGRAPLETETTERMEWGNLLEPVIAKRYESVTGFKTYRHNDIISVIHKGAPMLGNIDRAVSVDGSRPVVKGNFKTDRILEIKNVDSNMRGEWGEPGTNEIPACYVTQCQHYLGLTGASVCDVAALFGGNELKVYTITRDERMIAAMWDECAEWWNAYVVTDTAPPARTAADVEALFPASNEASIVADGEIYHAIEKLKFTRGEIAVLEKTEGELKDQICAYLGENERLISATGDTLATWKTSKGKKKVDYSGALNDALTLFKATPEIIRDIVAKRETDAPGSRRFIVK